MSTIRASTVLAAGTWDRAGEIDHVLVEYDRRHRRRIMLRTEGGRNVLLDLKQAVRLRDGDGLLLEGGEVIRVEARAEALAEIHAHDEGALVRIAWHLGDRHLPLQLLDERIRIRADRVIEEMVDLLGGHVEHIEAPFDPEPGTYAGGHTHPGDDHPHDEHDHRRG
jgi:urease accessory protein